MEMYRQGQGCGVMIPNDMYSDDAHILHDTFISLARNRFNSILFELKKKCTHYFYGSIES